MRRYKTSLLYSATDIVNFIECPQLTAFDGIDLETPLQRSPDDEEMLLIQSKGFAHEGAHLEQLSRSAATIVDIKASTNDLDEGVRLTVEAMQTGTEVIFQAVLRNGNLAGYADFLKRVPGRSRFGDYLYEVVDTKLARTPKAKFLVQLAFYSDLLGATQQSAPLAMHLVLGDRTEQTFRVADYSHYYTSVRDRFLEFLSKRPETYPDPCQHCDICHWRGICEEKRTADDHLIYVADIRGSQIKRLKDVGISTLAALGRAPEDFTVPKMARETFSKLRRQAALQLQRRETGENRIEVLPSAGEPGRGLNRLPTPSPGDMFFDIEGDPFEDGGLEYLFGVVSLEGEGLTFRPFWGHSRSDERLAFEAFMDFVEERLNTHPDAHIYHYGDYEATVLKRLMSLHGTREAAVDDLLRRGKLVNLYKVVRESILVSEPRYSIKNLESFYFGARKSDVKTAGGSIVQYERWKQTGDAAILDTIGLYNREDCESTHALRQWLLSLRPSTPQVVRQAVAEAPPAPVSDAVRQAEERIARFRGLLVDRLPEDRTTWSDDDRMKELTFHLIDFHRRAAKPAYWALYSRQEMTEEELIDDPECIAAMTLDPATPPYPEKQSVIYTYRYPEQDFKLKPGDSCVRIDSLQGVTELMDVNEDKRRVVLKQSKRRGELPANFSISPGWPISTDALTLAITRFADGLVNDDGRYGALRAYLTKQSPHIEGIAPGNRIVDESQPILSQAIQAVAGLRESYLFIQGPPGAGKTYTASHIIAALLRDGKRVAVSSNSHKAINNLLRGIEEVATAAGFTFRGAKKSTSGSSDTCLDGKIIEDIFNNDDAIGGGYQLLAGTAWLFADPDFDEAFDYIFVDEAGQVAVGNLVAMAVAAKNIVLLGDQMQLGQPIQGVHPGRSGESTLEYLLDGLATIPLDRGIFLKTTWRMHPDVCQFISDAVYDGRLEAEPENANQELILSSAAAKVIRRTGIHYWPVVHTGCSQRSEEEAAVVRELVLMLLEQRYRDRDGKVHAMTLDDILVVAPYNMQVNLLKYALPAGARVGTVDKFQGQEAQAVIVSMATSSEENLPRHVGFLFSRNRLNVAISRARCLSVLVASPALIEIHCKSPAEMALVNTLCWVMKSYK